VNIYAPGQDFLFILSRPGPQALAFGNNQGSFRGFSLTQSLKMDTIPRPDQVLIE